MVSVHVGGLFGLDDDFATTLKGWRSFGTRSRKRTDLVVFLVARSWHSFVSGTPRASRVVWTLDREESGTHFDRAGNS
jgi:hypothetical protein